MLPMPLPSLLFRKSSLFASVSSVFTFIHIWKIIAIHLLEHSPGTFHFLEKVKKKKSVFKELLEQLCFDLLYLLTKEGWKLAPDLHFDFLAFSPWPEILSFWNGSWSNPSSIHRLSPNAVWVFETFSFLRECRATICKLIWFCDQSIVFFGSF